MTMLSRQLALVSSLALVAVGCGTNESDDVTTSEDALSCGGVHHHPGNHVGHNHHRHHHHGHGGTGGTGTGGGGTGGQPHLTGTGGSAGSSMGGSGGSSMGGTGGSSTGGTGGSTMPDPRCAALDGIVSWWHADGDYDDAVGSNDGTTGGAVGFAAGEENQGFSLTGATGSFVEVPDDPSLMLTGAVTMDAWIFQDALGGRIIDKATANGRDGYMMDVAGQWLRLFVSGDQLISATPLPAGMFTHVAAVYDGSHLGVYINGVLSAEQATGAMVPNNVPLRIGADSNGGSMFAGIIDEPRVFGRALTADEIASLFWQSTHCQ